MLTARFKALTARGWEKSFRNDLGISSLVSQGILFASKEECSFSAAKGRILAMIVPVYWLYKRSRISFPPLFKTSCARFSPSAM